MKEERLKILEMVANGKISPEEAERLLQALEGRESRPDSAPEEKEKKEKKFLRIFISEAGGDVKKINIPLRLLRLGMDLSSFIPQPLQQKVGIASLHLSGARSLEETLKAIEELEVDISEPSGETVRIYTE